MKKIRTVKKKDKKTKKTSLTRQDYLSFFQILVAVIIGIVSICIMEKISNAANLIPIQSDIQHRTDAVLSITDELSAAKILYQNPSEEEKEYIRLIENRQIDAIFALLNTYEFACRQYLEKNIDRKTFQFLYNDGTLDRLLDKYKGMITSKNYHSIKKVNEEWR